MEEPEKPMEEESEVNSEQERGLAFDVSRVKQEVETIHLLPSVDVWEIDLDLIPPRPLVSRRRRALVRLLSGSFVGI